MSDIESTMHECVTAKPANIPAKQRYGDTIISSLQTMYQNRMVMKSSLREDREAPKEETTTVTTTTRSQTRYLDDGFGF